MGLPYWPWRFGGHLPWTAILHLVWRGNGGNTATSKADPATQWASRPIELAIVPNGMATPFVTFANAGTAYAPSGDTSVWGFAVDGSTDQASFVIDSTVGTFHTGSLSVGYSGTGQIVQRGGVVNVSSYWTSLGGSAGSVGTYRLDGGLFDPCGDYSSAFGDFGTGYLIQSGGTLLADRAIDFAKANDAAGYYMLSGSGILNAGELTFGQRGHGYFSQSGGTSTISLLRLASPFGIYVTDNASGTATFSGGTCSVDSLAVGSTGTHGRSRLVVDGNGASITVTTSLIFSALGDLESDIGPAGLSSIDARSATSVALAGTWTVVDNDAPLGKFDVIRAGSGMLSGDFASVVLPNTTDWSYGIDGDTLWVNHTPEPATLSILFAGMGLAAITRRRRSGRRKV